VVLGDGALGTALQGLGLPSGVPPEVWNRERPDAVETVHRSYADAGSQVLLTNSFRGNAVALERAGLGSEAPSLSRRAAGICRAVAPGRVVLGSMGPTGTLLAPLGGLSPERARNAFAEQAGALAAGGVDGIVLETFYDLRELELAFAAVLESTDLPVGCCMTFDRRGTTIMGTSVEAFVSALEGKGDRRLAFVGANCSLGPEDMLGVCERLCQAARLPVWIKPNAGRPQVVDGRTEYPTSPEAFAEEARVWVDQGAKVIGGCCGTTPDHVRRLAEVLEER